MLFYDTIESTTLTLLKGLFREQIFDDCRLVGGTSLALQYGHRRSIDLDLFGSVKGDYIEITNKISQLGSVSVLENTSNIHLFIVNGIKVDIVNYNYRWIDSGINEEGIVLASDKDIAAMKISAIENRGTKKDFVDIFFILKKYSLSDILGFYKMKYENHSLFRALMSLTYFDDAESDPMPAMIKSVKWDVVKQQLLDEVSKYKAN